MAAITADMVKGLRDKTGAGMMDCKAALKESNGEVEAAIDWLRAKGLSKAAKKADRVAAEGLIGVASAAKSGAVVEVNSETYFVARNAEFQKVVGEIAKLALKADGDMAKLAAMEYPKKKTTVSDHLKELIATIGENMSLRRTAALTALLPGPRRQSGDPRRVAGGRPQAPRHLVGGLVGVAGRALGRDQDGP